ncbi:uncharacterized protein LOC143561328 [Bidens hawaiensis]|uniref:uncharacterized protein LOC143561328 n=1 Tax=Bidens hawaiensis TaxID=980011 RepID=UPI00404A7333
MERANRSIKDGIKVRFDTKRTGWVDELPHALWAHRTQKKTSNFETPLSLTYGPEAMIPAKIGIPSARVLLITDNDTDLRLNSDLLEERRELALILERDYVFRNNEASGQELGKLAPSWEGPYKIKGVLDKVAYTLERLD